MSDALSEAQFAGTEAIAASSNKTSSGGGMLSQIEVGLGDDGKVRLQPAGTTQMQLYERYQGATSRAPRATQPKPVKTKSGVRKPRAHGA